MNRIKNILHHSGIQTGYLLDIGCGNGGYINELSQHVPMEFFGIDSSMQMLEQTSARDVRRLYINASFNNVLPFRDGTLDAVISVDSIHFSINLDLIFQEISRILTPGGVFIVCTHTVDDLKRQTLGTYFPKTIEIEIRVAKRLNGIYESARKYGLRRSSRDSDVIKSPPDRAYIKLFEKKCASALHHISSCHFNSGLKKLKRTAATKKRVTAHSYTTFAFQKPRI